MATDSQLFVFEFTLAADDWTPMSVKSGLKGWAKKFIFQLEEGDSGYRHFQGRISLFKKRRLHEIRPLLQEIFPKISLRPTVKEETKLFYEGYSQKCDTRLEGPFRDDDPEPAYIPRQIREITTLRAWQASIIELSKVWDTRTIHVIYDPVGNNGKSILTTYMGVHQLARTLPFVNDYKDIMRMVMDMPTSPAYIIDMPRAINKEKLFQMYAGIETVKSGYAYDDRYSFKDKYFDCPQIFVFTNTIPDYSLLSADRWKVWTIEDSHLVALRCNTGQDD